MVRTASALALLLLATACHRPAAVATPQADSMDAVFSRLSAKCGQSVPELQQLVQQGAERVREQRQIPMQADLFAVVLDHSTPPAPKRTSCAPKVDSLVYTIMQGHAPTVGR